MKLLTLVAAILVTVCLFAFTGGSSQSASVNVLLLHGWHGSSSNWSTAKAQFESAGIQAHALALPRNGSGSGDTLINADFVEAYIDQHDLTNVMVDGHSLGGTLVYELVRVRRNPAIVSAVTRDSNIQNPTGDTGFYCWFVPDQCETSPVRRNILSSALASVPILVTSYSGLARADVDCVRQYSIGHNDFLTDSRVNADAISWAKGLNPCSSVASTSVPTATQVPPTATIVPTATITQQPTATPTATQVPTCSWWQRIFNIC